MNLKKLKAAAEELKKLSPDARAIALEYFHEQLGGTGKKRGRRKKGEAETPPEAVPAPEAPKKKGGSKKKGEPVPLPPPPEGMGTSA